MTRCGACAGDYRPIPCSGPFENRILFLGERPGRHENALGRVFVGDTGEELDGLYLPIAGLERRDIRIGNTVRCWAPNNRKPTAKEVRECSACFLPRELERTSPEIVVLMGATACSLAPGISLERDHGIPFAGELMGHACTIFPTFHPALGIRGGKIKSVHSMTYLMEDFEALGELIKGTLRPKIDPWPSPRFQVLRTPAQVRRALTEGLVTPDLAIDTESQDGRVFSVQFCAHPSSAWFLYSRDRDACAELGRLCNNFRVVLHNAIADLDPLESLGIIPAEFVDTMHLAYHTGCLPQGLKSLAWRLLGARMRDYDDVVMPHSREAFLGWVMKSAWKVRRLTSRDKLSRETKALRRLYRNTAKEQGEKPYDPWEKWEELPGEVQRRIAGIAGRPPRPGIAHVPEKEAVEYGCNDAQKTLLVCRALEKKLESLGEEVVESDWAA